MLSLRNHWLCQICTEEQLFRQFATAQAKQSIDIVTAELCVAQHQTEKGKIPDIFFKKFRNDDSYRGKETSLEEKHRVTKLCTHTSTPSLLAPKGRGNLMMTVRDRHNSFRGSR